MAIDHETKQELKEHLANRGATVSAFMRSLIQDYLENNVKTTETSQSSVNPPKDSKKRGISFNYTNYLMLKK